MPHIITIFIGLFILIGLMALGFYVASCIALLAILATWIYLGAPLLFSFGNLVWGSMDSYLLTAIPLFILLGEILLRSGSAERMYRALSGWLYWLPGGLLHANVMSSTVFAAISGSSVATAATIGTVALPSLRQQQYNEKLALGSITAGGTLGILIPPSINMIIYGAITNSSIGRLFLAGILPGIVLSFVFMLILGLLCFFIPSLGPSPRKIERAKLDLRSVAVDIIPTFIVFFIVMGSIYAGIATPTEAAAIGVIGAILVSIIQGNFGLIMLHKAAKSAAKTSAIILLIIVAAFMLSFVVGLLGIPAKLGSWIDSLGLSGTGLLLALIIFYLILGCFMETLSMMIATVPIVVPMVKSFGISPIFFGIFLVIMMEISLITPPIGLNLYVVQGVRGKGSVLDVMAGSTPFVVILLLFVLAMVIWPQIILFS